MKLHELPVEVQLRILEELGHWVLPTVSRVNRHFHELCLTPQLWRRIVPPSAWYHHGIGHEPPNIRSWYIGTIKKYGRVESQLTDFVNKPDPDLALQIAKHGLEAMPSLMLLRDSGHSLGHVFWSNWFRCAILALEGVKTVLSDTTDPLRLAVASRLLIFDFCMPQVFSALYDPNYTDMSYLAPAERLQSLIQAVDQVKVPPLLKSCLFHRIATKYNLLHTSLFSLGTSSSVYCGVLDLEPPNFVEFSGDHAQIRSLREIQDRMDLMRVTTIKPGLDKSDILGEYLKAGKMTSILTSFKNLVPTPLGHDFFAYILDDLYGTSLYWPSTIPLVGSDLIGQICDVRTFDELGVVLCREGSSYLVALPSRDIRVPLDWVTPTTQAIPTHTEFGLDFPTSGHSVFQIGFFFNRYDHHTQRFYK